LAALTVLVYAPCKADVPAPPAPPSVPTGYCTSIYNELNGDLQAFNTQLATPSTWTPIPGGPTLYSANLQSANSNVGPSISGPNYLQIVLTQLQELKALGVQAVSVAVLFPVLYEPFYGSQTALQPYLDFYSQVAQAVRAAGLKLIVDDEALFSNDIAAGWTNMNTFYGTLTWPQYMAARAIMAATIAQTMQPDYIVLANEPDTEATQTGQQNLNIPADAAQMIAGEIAAVQALNLSPVPKLGAGFGTWLLVSGSPGLLDYTNAYVALPLDYIDIHIIPITTTAQQQDNFIANSLTVASAAAAAGKPVAISQAWLSKAMASEWDVLSVDTIRARQPFSFWAPLDAYFLQTMQALGNYTQMLYLVAEGSAYFFGYQTYGGTGANGGAANCTCTTTSCSPYEIMQTENSLASTAESLPAFTTTAFSYYDQLVTPPDTIPPSVPTNLTGTAGTIGANFSWTASTDNIGVAGYNVYRCTPPGSGQPCAGILIANTAGTPPLTFFTDSALTSGTLYNYQVQAFDLANNDSPLSTTLSLQTYRTSADSATNLVATAVSPQEIDLSWSPPSNPSGLGKYLVFSGTSASNLQQIAVAGSTTTTYKNMPLAPGTTYYYGIVAVEQAIDAAMSPGAYAVTLPLPNPPNVAAAPTPTTIALTWQENPQPGGLPVSSYQIFQGTTPGQLTKIATTTATTYTARSLSANTTYYFEIVAIDTKYDDSAPSDQISVTTLPMPAAPVNVVPTANSSTQVTVTWSEIIPTNGLPIKYYYIFRGTSPTGLTNLATRTASPFIDTGASPSATYYYAIEAIDTSYNVSPMSATVNVTTPPLPAAPVNVGATASSSTQVTVTWSENIPPHGLPIQNYTIFRGTSPAGLTKLTTRTASPFIDTGAPPNTTYYYGIEANDTGHGVSPMSAPPAQVTTLPLPAAPVNVVPTVNSSTEVTVTWSENIPPNGLPIKYYYIFRGTSPTGLTKLATRTASPFVDTGDSPNTTYYYAIEAIDTSYDVSPMSATAQVTTPPMPAASANVVATANSSTADTVTWSESIPTNGLPIKYYYIFRGTSPTGLANLATRTASPFIDTGVSANTTYYYAIEAVDTGGDVSPLSATAQVTTPN
jgi:fibronectin type 3 domain-containing protein